ncbi:hypothetical protein SUGI_0431460 [Cryptomeria japonica]|nr:hypothetical protein SUGI_0431460 [Cryptomeria japonica]
MFVSQVIIGILLATGMKEDEDISKGMAIMIILMVCTFVSAFAWSWGPLAWLIPSETFPLETRSAGQKTKNVPIEEMIKKVWRQHWLWKKYVTDSDLIDDEDGDAYANQETGKANGKAHHNSQL